VKGNTGHFQQNACQFKVNQPTSLLGRDPNLLSRHGPDFNRIAFRRQTRDPDAARIEAVSPSCDKFVSFISHRRFPISIVRACITARGVESSQAGALPG
jgi:hypothetical protein